MRACPLCLTKISPGRIAAYSYSLECPNCKTALELAPGSRSISIVAGLAAAALVWNSTQDANSALGWLLPLVDAFLAFSVVSPVVLMLLADLRVKPIETARAAEHATEPAPAHAGSHH